ncbi:hypothetical protein [Streptomyces marianii]|uniref:Uncharacterized protein n=1 Tax=Streptomyces marianii TaxID=1817406 RepID=A0A5R9DTM1_9ACTN|nr:hypothetical protein [Streptomyces marianii]TLQ39466.1 hypothetical protein FEF34_39575 [Streptomyces marianii]
MTISSDVTAPSSAPAAHRAAFPCPACFPGVPADCIRKDSCAGRCMPVSGDSDTCRNCQEWLCVGCGKHPVDSVPDLCPMCCD